MCFYTDFILLYVKIWLKEYISFLTCILRLMNRSVWKAIIAKCNFMPVTCYNYLNKERWVYNAMLFNIDFPRAADLHTVRPRYEQIFYGSIFLVSRLSWQYFSHSFPHYFHQNNSKSKGRYQAMYFILIISVPRLRRNHNRNSRLMALNFTVNAMRCTSKRSLLDRRQPVSSALFVSTVRTLLILHISEKPHA